MENILIDNTHDCDCDFDFEENFYNDTSEDIETTCLNCGFKEFVPDFIYGECSRKIYHFKLKKKVPTLYCCKCQKESAVPSSFLKN